MAGWESSSPPSTLRPSPSYMPSKFAYNALAAAFSVAATSLVLAASSLAAAPTSLRDTARRWRWRYQPAAGRELLAPGVPVGHLRRHRHTADLRSADGHQRLHHGRLPNRSERPRRRARIQHRLRPRPLALLALDRYDLLPHDRPSQTTAWGTPSGAIRSRASASRTPRAGTATTRRNASTTTRAPCSSRASTPSHRGGSARSLHAERRRPVHRRDGQLPAPVSRSTVSWCSGSTPTAASRTRAPPTTPVDRAALLHGLERTPFSLDDERRQPTGPSGTPTTRVSSACPRTRCARRSAGGRDQQRGVRCTRLMARADGHRLLVAVPLSVASLRRERLELRRH